MTLWNPFAFTVAGQARDVVAPVQLLSHGQMSVDQRAGIARAHYAFTEMARLHPGRNPATHGELNDGSPYRIYTIGPQTVVEVWPVEGVTSGRYPHGIGLVVDRNDVRYLALLTYNTALGAWSVQEPDDFIGNTSEWSGLGGAANYVTYHNATDANLGNAYFRAGKAQTPMPPGTISPTRAITANAMIYQLPPNVQIDRAAVTRDRFYTLSMLRRVSGSPNKVRFEVRHAPPIPIPAAQVERFAAPEVALSKAIENSASFDVAAVNTSFEVPPSGAFASAPVFAAAAAGENFLLTGDRSLHAKFPVYPAAAFLRFDPTTLTASLKAEPHEWELTRSRRLKYSLDSVMKDSATETLTVGEILEELPVTVTGSPPEFGADLDFTVAILARKHDRFWRTEKTECTYDRVALVAFARDGTELKYRQKIDFVTSIEEANEADSVNMVWVSPSGGTVDNSEYLAPHSPGFVLSTHIPSFAPGSTIVQSPDIYSNHGWPMIGSSYLPDKFNALWQANTSGLAANYSRTRRDHMRKTLSTPWGAIKVIDDEFIAEKSEQYADRDDDGVKAATVEAASVRRIMIDIIPELGLISFVNNRIDPIQTAAEGNIVVTTRSQAEVWFQGQIIWRGPETVGTSTKYINTSDWNIASADDRDYIGTGNAPVDEYAYRVTYQPANWEYERIVHEGYVELNFPTGRDSREGELSMSIPQSFDIQTPPTPGGRFPFIEWTISATAEGVQFVPGRDAGSGARVVAFKVGGQIEIAYAFAPGGSYTELSGLIAGRDSDLRAGYGSLTEVVSV